LFGLALDDALVKQPRSSWYIGRVKYLPERKIVSDASRLAKRILELRSDRAAAESVLLKRRSFAHEEEVRVLVIDRHRRSKAGVVKVRADPHKLVQSVMLDSRTPPEVAEMYKTYLRERLGFKGRISKSTLYDLPEQLVVKIEQRNG
jgi:hypothetical protein